MRCSMPKLDRPNSEFKAQNRRRVFDARFQRLCSDESSEGLSMLMYVTSKQWKKNQPRKKHRAQARWAFATKLKTFQRSCNLTASS